MRTRNKQLKTCLYLLSFLFSLSGRGQKQINTTQLEIDKLPPSIKVVGKIKTAVRWTDKTGDNIVITSETGITANLSEPLGVYSDAAIYAYHYSVGKDSTYMTWKVYDYIKKCPVDIEAKFIKNTFTVTDLDNNGESEVWLMYKTVCHGDVSPCNMKIIMYQGQQKYAMRGQNKVEVSDQVFYGGEYKFDKAFEKGPFVFMNYAKSMWDKNIMQEWGD